jgi:hypothetical protein
MSTPLYREPAACRRVHAVVRRRSDYDAPYVGSLPPLERTLQVDDPVSQDEQRREQPGIATTLQRRLGQLILTTPRQARWHLAPPIGAPPAKA